MNPPDVQPNDEVRMPLRDHFHRPTMVNLPWESVSAAWAITLMGWLNRTLPADEYRAFANIHLGAKVEADVSEFERPTDDIRGSRNGSGPAVATLTSAPPALDTFPATFPDDIEVRVTETRHAMLLVGVIELVSPGNKMEADERAALVAKCVSYLRRGVGVVVVDVVTDRLRNLHNELVAVIGGPSPRTFPETEPTYVVGYRPIHRGGRNEIDVWPLPAPVGDPLPSVPLALRRGRVVNLDLEETYTAALFNCG